MYELVIEVGIGMLLIYTPLAFGGVTEGSVAFLEIVTGLLMLVWLAKIVSLRDSRRHRRRKTTLEQAYTFRVITPVMLMPIGLFLALLVAQLLPLPAGFIKWLSPATYHVYADAAAYTGQTLASWLPLTVHAQATETELYKMLAYCAIFLLMINHIRSPRQIRRLIFIIVAIGVCESIYGLGEYFSGRHQIFTYKKQSSYTVSGTFVNKNHFAGYLEMVIPLTFGVLFARLKERGQSSTKKLVRFVDEKYMKALLVGFLLCVLIGAFLLSGSRGGFISFVGGMMCLTLLASTRRLLRKWAVIGLIFSIVTAGIVGLLGFNVLVKHLQTFANLETEQSVQYRSDAWRGALKIFQDYPVFGSGLGTFPHLFPQYQDFPSEYTFTHAENDYVQLLSETGLVGVGLILWAGWLFFSTTVTAWNARQSRWSIILVACGLSAIFSLMIHSLFDFNLHIPSNALLLSVVVALTSVAAHSKRRSYQ